jgi:hypothetical protein
MYILDKEGSLTDYWTVVQHQGIPVRPSSIVVVLIFTSVSPHIARLRIIFVKGSLRSLRSLRSLMDMSAWRDPCPNVYTCRVLASLEP